jgi:hypothetical protein
LSVIDSRSSEFFVRFDQSRFESAPEVLFARAPTSAPGNYSLHWAVAAAQR